MERLKRILCRPVKDTPRTREYQQYIDDAAERILDQFDPERGLAGTKGIAQLPDEANPDYINLSHEERAALTDDEAAQALRASTSRGTTAGLGVLAWCYRSPLSRFHKDPRCLDMVTKGIESFMRRQRADGVWVLGLVEDGGFGMGWTVEGMIFAIAWLCDDLDADFHERALDMFRRAVGSFKEDAGFHPVCNQHAVWCFNMMLFGLVLDEEEHLAAAQRQWEVCQYVFGRDGQVIEQGGPCANYSRTTFIYAFLYIVLAETHDHDAQIKEACKWFRRMHTRSMHPFEGMSSRSSHFLTHSMMDVVAALERFAPEEPIFTQFIDDFIAQEMRDHGRPSGMGHGASPLIWAMMEHEGVTPPSEADVATWREPFDRMYWTWDIQYLLVHRRCQTAVTFRGRSALMGLQTWAWENEPPILHASDDTASATIALGIDTASFGVSHNTPHHGAGLKTEDVTYIPGDWSELNLQYEPVGIDRGIAMAPIERYFRWTQTHHHPGGFRRYMTPGDPTMVVTRWAKLWSFYIFTPASTLVLQNGDVGARTTRWAFNPVCVPTPKVVDDGVAFEGRKGRLFALGAQAQLDVLNDLPVAEFALDANQLGAFAFSNGEFAFGDYDTAAQTLTFRDAVGNYRADFSTVLDRGHVTWDNGARVNRL